MREVAILTVEAVAGSAVGAVGAVIKVVEAGAPASGCDVNMLIACAGLCSSSSMSESVLLANARRRGSTPYQIQNRKSRFATETVPW